MHTTLQHQMYPHTQADMLHPFPSPSVCAVLSWQGQPEAAARGHNLGQYTHRHIHTRTGSHSNTGSLTHIPVCLFRCHYVWPSQSFGRTHTPWRPTSDVQWLTDVSREGHLHKSLVCRLSVASTHLSACWTPAVRSGFHITPNAGVCHACHLGQLCLIGSCPCAALNCM